MFDIRLALYDRDTFVKVIPQAQDIQASTPLNDTGAINFTIPTDVENSIPYSEILTWLDRYDLSLQWSDDSGGWWEAPGCRFVFSNDSSNITAVRDQYSISGVTTDFDLTGMLRLDTKHLNKEGNYVYKAATPGSILATMLSNAQSNNLGTAIKWDFTADKDSSGAAWPTKVTMDIDPAITVRQVLERLETQGVIDWRMNGFTLQAYVSNKGLRVSKNVEFVVGREVDSGPQKRDRSNMANVALVTGDGGKTMIRTLPTNARRGGRATTVTQAGVSDTATMTILADATLSALATPSEQLTREFTVTEDMVTFPLKDFVPGDIIWANGAGGDLEQLRVHQITIAKTVGDDGAVSGNIVLADRFLENQIKQKRRIDALASSNVSGGSGGTPTPPPRPALVVKPKAPTNLQVTSQAYLTAERNPAAVLTATWDGVTQDINGNTIDGDISYEVGTRLRDDQLWSGNQGFTVWPRTTALSAVRGNLRPNATYQVIVRAVTSSGVSDPSAMVEITTGKDTVPPQRPSSPILTTKLGTVSAEWDGKDYSGSTTWPPDFSGIYLYSGDTKVGVLDNVLKKRVVGAFDAGTYATATFTAFDIWGNESDHSAVSSILVRSVLDDTTYAADMAGLKTDIEDDYNGKIANAVDLANAAKSVSDTASSTAVAAQQKAVEAWSQAGLALTSANGKADIFHSATTPPGTTHPDGSTWFVQASDSVGSDIVQTARWDSASGTWKVGLLGPNAVSALDLGKATVGQLDGQYIKANTIKTASLQVGAVTSDALASNAVTTVKIADGAITGDKITVDSVLAKRIASGIVISDIVRAGSVTAEMLNATALNGQSINGGVITGALIQTNEEDRRGIKLSTSYSLKGYDSSGVLTLDINGVRNTIVGDLRTNTPGNPMVAVINYTTTGQPGIWFSPDGSVAGTVSSIYRETSGLLVIRSLNYDNPYGSPQGTFMTPLVRSPAFTLAGSSTGTDDGGLQFYQGNPTLDVTYISEALGAQYSTPSFLGMQTTSYNANCFIDANNRLYKKSSTRKIKLDIQDMDVDYNKILDIRPVQFHDRLAYEHPETGLPKYWVPGLIAEEVDDLGLGLFVPKDEDGEIDGFDYERLWILLVPVVKKLKARVDELERFVHGDPD